MIAVSDAVLGVLRGGSFTLRARATITLDGVVIAANVPIIDGSEEYDASLAVPERVTIAVPRVADGINWAPTSQSSPLSAFGQRLKIQLGVDLGNDGVEWFDRGEYLIYQTDVDEDQVNVAAVGLLGLIDEARLVSPYQPSGTLTATVRGLIEPALTVAFDPGLTDRTVPAGINFDEDRLQALQEVLDAWPARAITRPDGTLYLYPDADPAAASWQVLTVNTAALKPAQIATVVRLEGGSTRDGTFNAVVARGTAADGGQVQGVAYDRSASASAYGGPFNPLPVPFFYASPLLTTTGQCNAAANTILTRKARQSYGRWDVQMVPCPVLVGGDGIQLWQSALQRESLLTVVDKMTLPFNAAAGPMSMTLRSVSRG